MHKFWKTILISSLFAACEASYANTAIDTETLDANQHVIMFERAVDAYMAGQYDQCGDLWLRLARAGDAIAARNLALLYHRGLGVPKDLEEAEYFYRFAADRGVTSAQVVLGTMLIKGDEIKRNFKEAQKYLAAAQKAGDPVAAWNLGLLYENGLDVSRNLEKALSLFRQAARGGHEQAIMRISGQENTGYKEKLIIQGQASKEKIEKTDAVFGTDKDYTQKPVLTFEQKKKIDKKHDQKNYSDRINFAKELQSDDPDLIFKDEASQYDKKDKGIDKEIDPFGIDNSKENRNNQVLPIDQIGDNLRYIEADQAYMKKNYLKAKGIWEELLELPNNDEAAYRLAKLYQWGKGGVQPDKYKVYYYLKKGADAGGQKCDYELEAMKSKMSDKEFLDFEQKTIDPDLIFQRK